MEFNEAQILAFIKGELPKEIREEYEKCWKNSPEFREKVETIRYIYSLSENLNRQKEIDTQSSWRKVHQKIVFLSYMAKTWNFVRTVAAILLPLFLFYQYLGVSKSGLEGDEQITLYSAPGIITKATLSDGSEIWLNAQSQFSYPRIFKGKDRTVKLVGEAYFKVAADPKRRFNVLTPHRAKISAYGTEFNVNAYLDEEDSKVTLTHGKVEVIDYKSRKNEILHEGEKAILNSQTDEIKIVPADVYVETAWKDGKLVFHREKLSSIVRRLSRKYGASIQLEGETINNYEYTATFSHETLEEILDLLVRSAPITYSITHREQLKNDTFSQPTVKIRHK